MNGLRSLNKGADGPPKHGRPPGRPLLTDQEGAVSFKAVFWVLFLASFLYGSYKFGPPYFSFYMLKTDVEEEAKIAHMFTDAELEKHILKKADGWGIPLDPDNIDVARNGSYVTITVRYTDKIEFPGGYRKDLEHEITVRRPLKDASRVLQ